MPDFTLIDDGTLDTVYKCDDCGVEERFTFAGTDFETYDDFLDWINNEALDEHECSIDDPDDPDEPDYDYEYDDLGD